MKHLLLIFLFLLTACTTTEYIEVPKETIRTEYKDRIELKHDSIYIRDSVGTTILNDTVYITKYKQYYKWRDRIVKDTICKTDTITKPIPYEVVKEVNKLKDWQVILMIVGGVSIGLLLFKLKDFIK